MTLILLVLLGLFAASFVVARQSFGWAMLCLLSSVVGLGMVVRVLVLQAQADMAAYLG